MKLTKKTFISCLIILIALTSSGILYLFNPFNKQASAAWFDDNWGYRKAITVTVTSNASDITNLETLLTVDTTGITAKLQSSCQDLRFTNTNGKLLPYYIDSCTNNSATNKVWVMADLVPKNTTTYTMYMYYGNPSAISGSSSSKFNLFNGLVGYWTMNESAWTNDCSSLTVKDSSVKGNNGKSCPNGSGPTGGASGNFGNAGSFDGSNDSVDVPDNASLNPSTTITVSAWFKQTSTGVARSLIHKGDGATNSNSAYEMGFFHSGLENRIRFEVSSGSGWNTAEYGTDVTDTTSWHFAVGTYDGSTVKFYLDGVLQASTTASVTMPDDNNVFRIGMLNNGSFPFPGSIDEVRIYNRAISAAEVIQLYNNPGTIATTVTATSLPSTSFASEETATAPAAYWKFDEGTGTTTSDSTTTSATATLAGTTKPTWQTEDQCVVGKCLFFDGTTSNNTVATAVNGVKTVALWVRPNSVTTSALIDLDGGTHKITVSSGTISATGFTSPTIYVNGVVSSTLAANTWQLVEVTTGTSFNTTSSLTMGKSSTTFFQGFMDEVKIYDYARSSAQVLADYNARANNKGANVLGSNIQNQPNALSNGLVGYWKMDEASWNGTSGEAIDSSGSGRNGTSQNGTNTTSAKFGNGGSFDASDDRVKVSTSGILFGLTAGTVSAWVKPNNADSTEDAIYSENETNGNNFQLSKNSSNQFRLCIKQTGASFDCVTDTTTTIVANTWYHVVATFDSSSSTKIRVYVNGVQKVTDTTWDGTFFESINSTLIGDYENAGAFSWGGLIDEVRTYNRALSSADIATLYNFAPGPVGYWKFDEGSGTDATDTSGNGNTAAWGGTLGNQWKLGKYGGAGKFNGSDNYAGLSTTTSLSSPFGAGQITIETWLKADSIPADSNTNAAIAFGANGGSSCLPSYLTVNNSNQLTAGFQQLVTADTNLSTTISTGTWYHVAYTFINGGKFYYYINGVVVNSSTPSLTLDTAAQIFDLRFGSNIGTQNGGVGSNCGGGPYYFNGSLDETRIYNYVRTQKQIIEDMNASHPAPGSPINTPVGFWRFDEGADNTCSGGANDVCNSGFKGSLLDGAESSMSVPATSTSGWTQSGKFGKGLIFDGTTGSCTSRCDDLVNAGSDSSIDDLTANPMSLSAWIYPNTMGEGSQGVIMAKNSGATPSSGWLLQFAGTNALKFSVDGTTDLVRTTSNNAITLGAWNYVTLTWDGVFTTASSVHIFVNGIEASYQTTTSGATIVSDAASSLYFGNDSSGASTFDGTIDEVKIYAGALIQSEILLDMNRGQSQVLGSLSDNSTYQKQAANQEYCVPGDSTSCVAPVGRWDFEEGSGTSAKDTSGGGNSGVITTASYAPGKIGSALNFGSSDVVDVTGNSPLDLSSSSYTIEFWVNPSAIPSTFSAMVGTNHLSCAGNTRNNILIGFRSSTALTIATCNDDTDYNYTMSANTWYYVTATYNSTSRARILYVNGTSLGSGTQADQVGTTANWQFGKSPADGTKFTGKLDNIRIFNYVRAPAQVAWDYNKGEPIARYRFDECQGTVIHDSSGSSYNGTITVGASGSQTAIGTCISPSDGTGAWYNGRNGKYNASLSFDGNDDFVTTSAFSPLATAGKTTTVLSWGGWFYPTTSVASKTLLEKASEFQLITDASSIPICGIYTTSFQNSAVPPTALTLNAWNHVICTYDGTNINTYLNGVLIKQSAQTSSVTAVSSILYMAETSGAANRYLGQIDDVRIFNYALTATQAKNIYNEGFATRFGPATGAP